VFYSAHEMNKQRNYELDEQLMHIVLHGMLGHFLHKDEYTEHRYRNSLMDVQVAYVMSGLGLGGDSLEEAMHNAMQSLDGDFSMRQYYRALADATKGERLVRIERRVSKDDHREWDKKTKNMEAESAEAEKEHREKVKQLWERARNVFTEAGEQAEDEERQSDRLLCILEKRFRERGYGTETGTEKKSFGIGKRKGYNYRELLKNLITVREVTKEFPDSIDPMLYHYGLELYEDVPLLEPLECAEQCSPGLIVIAVDVSGSCARADTMELFWNETFSCISEMKEVCGEGQLLVLQCDNQIQNEEWISLSGEWKWPETVCVAGMGGTSFIPVFDRISELQEEQRVEALLYLTDGNGEYPAQPPEYPVYFIMRENDYERFERNAEERSWIEGVRLEKAHG